MLSNLSGCTPLFDASTQEALSHIQVSPIPERSGQVFHHLLVNTLQAFHPHKLYDLKVTLSESSFSMGLGKDAHTTLSHVTTTADYRLLRCQDQKEMAAGKLSTHNAYNVTLQKVAPATTCYSVTTAKEFVSQVNLRNLAHLLTRELARHLSTPDLPPSLPLAGPKKTSILNPDM